MSTFPLLEKPDGPAQPWALPPEMICMVWHQPSGRLPSPAQGNSSSPAPMPLPAAHSSGQRQWTRAYLLLTFPRPPLRDQHFLKRLHDKEGECPDRPQFLRSQGACLSEAKPAPSSAGIWSAGQLCGPAYTVICPRQTPTEGGGMDELTHMHPAGWLGQVTLQRWRDPMMRCQQPLCQVTLTMLREA